MKLVAKHANDKLAKKIVDSFYHHAVLFAHEFKIDALKIEFSNRHESHLEENHATIRINPKDAIFQDVDVITPFVCQEIARLIIVEDDLPEFLEDIICGRRAAKLYPKEYLQLCYLRLLKYKRITNLQEFLDANKHWILFYPLDSYNSDFLKKLADKLRHDKKLEILCRQLFNSTKSSLSSSENLKKAIAAYENCDKNAGR